MPLVASILASGIAALTPTMVEGVAISGLTSAWDTYFQGASVAGVPVTPGAYSAAIAAFQNGLAGMSAPSAGAAKIAGAVSAFWSALSPLGATLWILTPNLVVAPLTPPTGLGGLQAALQAAFTNNTSSKAPAATAANSIAAALHANGGIGGMVIVQPPLPAPPVPTLIL